MTDSMSELGYVALYIAVCVLLIIETRNLLKKKKLLPAILMGIVSILAVVYTGFIYLYIIA